MNLSDKIEEIRQKPEHIRIRYVWGAVAISMFFIIIIWAFSIKDLFKANGLNKEQKNYDFQKDMEELNNISDSAPSVKEIINNSDNNPGTSGEGVQNSQGQENNNLEVKGNSVSNLEEENNSKKEVANPLLPVE